MRFIDLFAGIGGFRLGLQKLGFSCVFSVEIDKYARQTYFANFNDMPLEDIREVSTLEIPRYDILCAGFPCQSFSISGKRKGFSDDRGSVFFELIRILRNTKPRFFILENVPNLLTINSGKTFDLILNSLEAETYKIKFKVLNSKDFRVPQHRKRLFIMGFLYEKDWFEYQFPEGSPCNLRVRDILQQKARDSLFISEDSLRAIEKKKKEKGYLSQGQRIYSIDRYSIVQTANGGGWGAKTGLYRTKEGVRKLSFRESARLQGFPDGFKFPVSNSQAQKQIGNAVTVTVIKALGQSLGSVSSVKASTSSSSSSC